MKAKKMDNGKLKIDNGGGKKETARTGGPRTVNKKRRYFAEKVAVNKQAHKTFDELGIKMVKEVAYNCSAKSIDKTYKKTMERASFSGVQMEARPVVRGPAVYINGEAYYSEKLWPYMQKKVLVMPGLANGLFIDVHTLKKTFICRAETKKSFKAFSEPKKGSPLLKFRGIHELQKQLDRIERRLDVVEIFKPLEPLNTFLKRQTHLQHHLDNMED